jgi:hypothetical protein
MSLWLAKNQKSNEVLALQSALNGKQDLGRPLLPNGVFDDDTETRVRDFQRNHGGLKVDGIAGPNTLGAIFRKAVVKVELESFGGMPDRMSAGPTPPFAPPFNGFHTGFHRRPMPPRQPKGVSFGSLAHRNLSWFSEREQKVLEQVKQTPPKILPAPPSPRVINPLKRERSGPYPSPAATAVSLSPYHPFESRRFVSRALSLLDFEATLEGTVSGVSPLVSMEFSTNVVLNRLRPWIAPSVGYYKAAPGDWGLKAELTLFEQHIDRWEWGKMVLREPAEIGPYVALFGTVMWPQLLGDRPEISFTAGLGWDVEHEIGHTGIVCSLGIVAGMMVFRPEKVEAEIRPFPLTGVFTGHFRCERRSR